MRALRGAAQGGGPLLATSRGVGQSPTKEGGGRRARARLAGAAWGVGGPAKRPRGFGAQPRLSHERTG